MKSWPFLFKGAMALATLAGIKTQTRRLLTPHATLFDAKPWPKWAKDNPDQWHWNKARVEQGPSPVGANGDYLVLPHIRGGDHGEHILYPRIRPGHKIWGKENFALSVFDPEAIERDIKNPSDWSSVSYQAGYEGGEWTYESVDEKGNLTSKPMKRPPWKPSLHMPKWASRIDLDVLNVKIERLQDITPEDALAEGIDTESEIYHTSVNILDNMGVVPGATHDIPQNSPEVATFKALWDSINWGRGAGWDANPWVIVYHYERTKP
jgi:hypothetical protein